MNQMDLFRLYNFKDQDVMIPLIAWLFGLNIEREYTLPRESLLLSQKGKSISLNS